MGKSLKDRTISGMIWAAIYKFGVLGISFSVNLVLARLLTPYEFGIIGMILVFTVISEAIVDGGFASALIQKRNPTQADYSTIFYWNLLISIFLYIGLYFAAPFIEQFYKMQGLKDVLRVLGIIIVINSFNIIQFTRLRKNLNFKSIAKVNISAVIISSTVAIILALNGYGVWSLVVKMICISIIQSLWLWIAAKWSPSFIFSFHSFKELFGFGSFVLLSSILDRLYSNIQSLVIGRAFSPVELGYFTQARKLEHIPVKGLSTVVDQVTYPLYSNINDNKERVKNAVRKSLKSITYLNFPLMILLILVAEPLITILYSDKWIQSIPYFQILCVGGMVWTLNTTSVNIIKSMGRSDLFFFIQLLSKFLGICLMIFGLKYGILGFIWSVALSGYLIYGIYTYFTNKLINYSITEQLKDILPSLVTSLIVGVFIYFIFINLILTDYLRIFLISFTYLLLYISFSIIFKLEAYYIYHSILKEKIKK